MSTYVVAQFSDDLRIAYREVTPSGAQLGIIVLIHGFPQTSYQYRHAIPLLVDRGYRCIAPDYRGAGGSSKPEFDFTKATMASDIYELLNHLNITEPVHLVGHDIGGMIAFAFAHAYPKRLKSVCWGECPLPGTKTYYRDRTEHAVQQFHFIFHSVPDLPEALIKGNERIYVSHFLNKIAYNLAAFTEADIDYYTAAYSQPGAMRCGLGVYRAFEQDAHDNQALLKTYGKINVPTMVLSGERSRHKAEAEEMVLEVTEKKQVDIGVVKGAAHYLAEENPKGFVEVLLGFIEKHP
ncbi:hypothetical protein LTR29_005907 [Friedmanniomyces endolithicus]|nr:hypothetical protein LTR29_005907 [Friedmanniomyces endolithicus]